MRSIINLGDDLDWSGSTQEFEDIVSHLKRVAETCLEDKLVPGKDWSAIAVLLSLVEEKLKSNAASIEKEVDPHLKELESLMASVNSPEDKKAVLRYIEKRKKELR